jgi:hypothetical protein
MLLIFQKVFAVKTRVKQHPPPNRVFRACKVQGLQVCKVKPCKAQDARLSNDSLTNLARCKVQGESLPRHKACKTCKIPKKLPLRGTC